MADEQSSRFSALGNITEVQHPRNTVDALRPMRAIGFGTDDELSIAVGIQRTSPKPTSVRFLDLGPESICDGLWARAAMMPWRWSRGEILGEQSDLLCRDAWGPAVSAVRPFLSGLNRRQPERTNISMAEPKPAPMPKPTPPVTIPPPSRSNRQHRRPQQDQAAARGRHNRSLNRIGARAGQPAAGPRAITNCGPAFHEPETSAYKRRLVASPCR